mmetsp:Transcript_39584/g.55777  ORF Transcript_39584/g.55777 Transcript_39584/m.55777 type:complete len:107 (-) Transcript_39584:209-529(-)
MHLYSSLLAVIAFQLRKHSSRALGCYGLLVQPMQHSWWADLRRLWGYNNTRFTEVMKEEKMNAKLLNESELAILNEYISPSHKAFMDSFRARNNEVLEICLETLKG